ncbi:MAG: hypothetical protein L0H83_15980 [Salinisphaera sp.]|nr:hypothetical protein [Salinisphaera sp.]
MSKDKAVHEIARHCQGYPHLRGYPVEYLVDVVRVWADAPTARTEPEWMEQLRKSSRQLHRIKSGNKERGRPGVWQVCDDLRREASATLDPVFRQRGLIAADKD